MGNPSSEAHAPMRAILYDAAGRDRDVRLDDIDVAELAGDQLLWVDVGIRDCEVLPPILKSAQEGARQVGRLELFDDYYCFAIALDVGQTSVLRFAVGRSWVLTASEQRPVFFDEFVEADQGETLKGRLTSTAFVASLLMRHLDGYRARIAQVDFAIDKLDDVILRGRERRSPLNSLAALRRQLSELRAVLTEQRSVIHGLIAPDFLAHVSTADRDFLIEVNRIFEKLEDDISRARETVIGSFELYATRVAQDTNQLLKILTIVTVITGFVGAVAGIFGMNFDTPIPHSGLAGFVIVTGAMLASSVAIAFLAIWRRWI